MASTCKANRLDVLATLLVSCVILPLVPPLPDDRTITPMTCLFLSDSFCRSCSSAASIRVFDVCREQCFRWYTCILVISRLSVICQNAIFVIRGTKGFSPDRASNPVSSGQTRSSNYSTLHPSQGNTPATRTRLATPVKNTTSISPPLLHDLVSKLVAIAWCEMVQPEFEILVVRHSRNVTEESNVCPNDTRITTAMYLNSRH